MSDGPLAAFMRGHFGADHVPVPSGHAPRLDAFVTDSDLVVSERGTNNGAWVRSPDVVEVRR